MIDTTTQRSARVRQDAYFLTNVLKDVFAGKLTPAAFQRPYVWEANDVLALCDSVLAGYPIGSFTIWEPRAELNLSRIGRNRLDPIALQPAGPHDAGLILDGQNRLASFAWMTLEPGATTPTDLSEAERRTWAAGKVLVVDLAERAVRFVDAADATQGFTLPAHTLISGQANQLVRKRWEREWGRLDEDEKNAGIGW